MGESDKAIGNKTQHSLRLRWNQGLSTLQQGGHNVQLSRNPLAGFMITVGMVAFCCVLISAASAQTPDGQTPAGESVCDALQAEGVTRGLYGLCVAFCEAQDWESCPNGPGNLRDISRENLATIAGTATESVIRTLSDFRSEKLIDMKDGNIMIINQKKLEYLVN